MSIQPIQSIPLNQLHVTTMNVRSKTDATPFEDLVSSIAAHGLMQNLVVSRSDREPEGYIVVAGGRRLRAMQKLEQNDALPETLRGGIPCLVVDSGSTKELSLVENVVRAAMHPADEFLAFRSLVEEHKLTVPQVAERFGRTAKHVEQRLRLGNVAPELLDEYRAGNANLEQITALAIVTDHDAQRKAWAHGASVSYYRQPDQLRGQLVNRDVSLRSAVGAFVGVEAYEAAGGTARRDLFSDFVTLPDSKLVQKLAKAKLEAEAKELRKKGWGWVEVKPEFDYVERSKYHQSGNKTPSAKHGVVVTIRHDGALDLVQGLLKPGQKAPAAAGAKKAKVDTRGAEQYLIGVRSGVLSAHLRQDPELALVVLATAMASTFFNLSHEPCCEVLVGEIGTYRAHTQVAGKSAANPEGVVAREAWEKRLRDGAKKTGSLLAWLMKQDQSVAYDLLAFMAADSIDTDGYNDDSEVAVHAFAKTVGADLSAGAALVTQEWLAKQNKAYILVAVTDAAGTAEADALEKGKVKDLAANAYALLVKCQWVPPQLREPAKPKPAAKKAAKKATKSSKAK